VTFRRVGAIDSLYTDRHDPCRAESALAADPVVVAVEAVWVGADDAELLVRDVLAVEIGRRRRDADVGV